MITSGDNDRAEQGSRRDSLKGLPGDLGQGLPDSEAPPRTKYDDPKVAVAVLGSQRNHLDAVFDAPNRQVASNARAETTKAFRRDGA